MGLENFTTTSSCSSLFSKQEEEQKQSLDYFLNLHYSPSLIYSVEEFGGVGVDTDDENILLGSNLQECSSSPLLSSSEASTAGYLLQDAVAERCNLRRVIVSSSAFDDTGELQHLLQGIWNSNCSSDLMTGFTSVPERRSSAQRKKNRLQVLLRPFNFVKPGGSEEIVTLADINARLLMRPTRPVKHPVGKFACLPSSTRGGRGLSGKAVIGFRRIHTSGKGSITIIRTRG